MLDKFRGNDSNDSLMATTAHVKQHSKTTLCLTAYTPRGCPRTIQETLLVGSIAIQQEAYLEMLSVLIKIRLNYSLFS